MRQLHFAPLPADQYPLFAPVKLKGFSPFEAQGNVGLNTGFAVLPSLLPDKIAHHSVAALIAALLELTI